MFVHFDTPKSVNVTVFKNTVIIVVDGLYIRPSNNISNETFDTFIGEFTHHGVYCIEYDDKNVLYLKDEYNRVLYDSKMFEDGKKTSSVSKIKINPFYNNQNIKQ